jgi:cell division protein YceG involved in septum cleavage
VKNSFKNKIKNINSQKKISIQNSKIKNILIIVISIIFVFIFGIFYKNILENNLKTGFEKLSSISNIHDYKEVRNTINEAKSDFAISSIMLFPLDLMFNNPIFQNKQYALVSDINS